jgi:intermediate cleaving peptidase 55
MVVTIEPSIFVPDDIKYPQEFRNLAMRIEDMVLVGKEDFEVLSDKAPKTVEDIETACLR